MNKNKKEVVTKKKFKFMNFLLALLVLYLFSLFIYKIIIKPINNIIIDNNKYLTDQEVIDISGIRDYPSLVLTTKSKIKNKLLKNNLIKEVKINKNLNGQVTITITENTPLIYYKPLNKIVLDNDLQIDNSNNYIVPTLLNNLDDDMLNKFVTKYNDIDNNIRLMISEIKYVPNDIDKERFIFTMNDGNYVYITLYKITAINEYIDILSTIDDNKGILYLDSGNYFEIID